jgi:hypothetical protein
MTDEGREALRAEIDRRRREEANLAVTACGHELAIFPRGSVEQHVHASSPPRARIRAEVVPTPSW